MSERKVCFSDALLPSGWHRDVAISVDDKGMIETVATDTRSPGGSVDGIAIPGLANVHSHAHQRAMAGLAEVSGDGEDSFWTWRETMYAMTDRIEPGDLKAIAAQLYVETLKAGFTSIGEFQYLHHGRDGTPYENPAEMSLQCLNAADEVGVGITILPVLYAYGGFGGQATTAGQRRFANGLRGFLEIVSRLKRVVESRPDARLGIAPHSLRAVTRDLLADCVGEIDNLAPGLPIHIHVAEQVKEVDDCVAAHGKRPVELLMDWQELSQRWCLIHATHMTEIETTRFAATRAVAGLCPTTEANLGDGIFNGRKFAAAGGTIAIGTDSHISVSPAEDLRQLEYSQRLLHRGRNILARGPRTSTGRTLFDAVSSGGAQALGQPQGALAKGNRADIVVLDRDHPALAGRQGDAILDSWIFSGGNGCVRDVFVGGKQVITNRTHPGEEAILRRFRNAILRLSG